MALAAAQRGDAQLRLPSKHDQGGQPSAGRGTTSIASHYFGTWGSGGRAVRRPTVVAPTGPRTSAVPTATPTPAPAKPNPTPAPAPRKTKPRIRIRIRKTKPHSEVPRAFRTRNPLAGIPEIPHLLVSIRRVAFYDLMSLSLSWSRRRLRQGVPSLRDEPARFAAFCPRQTQYMSTRAKRNCSMITEDLFFAVILRPIRTMPLS
jgi:hypothetical protein